MKKSFFTDLIPPPSYLLMPAFGLDISDRSLKYVELSGKKGRFSVSRFGGHLIPAGIIESGEVKDINSLVEVLKSLKEEIGSKYIISALPEEKAFLARIKLPLIGDDEVRDALEARFEEYIPLSLNEAIFDYTIIDRVSSGDKLEVYLIAFPRKIVEDYSNAFKSAGFTVLALEMEMQASARVIVPKTETGTVVLVDFGKTRTSFGIVSKNEVQFTTTIRVAGDELDKALIKNLGVDSVEAEKIKKERGFVRGAENEKVFNSLLPIISVIKDEIGKCIAYWDSNLTGSEVKPVSKVLLCGGDSNLFGLPEYFSYELKMPVELGNPWTNILSFDDYIPEIELRESLAYSIALGLALRGTLYYQP
jgi:type IV pilus assembly protein PilM